MIADKEMALKVKRNLISKLDFYELEIDKIKVKCNKLRIGTSTKKLLEPKYQKIIIGIQKRREEIKIAISNIYEVENGWNITNDAFMYSGVSNEDLDEHLISNAVAQ
jgi:hypothetical protein